MEEQIKKAHKKIDEVKELLLHSLKTLETEKSNLDKEKKEFESAAQKIEKVNFPSQITLDVGELTFF